MDKALKVSIIIIIIIIIILIQLTTPHSQPLSNSSNTPTCQPGKRLGWLPELGEEQVQVAVAKVAGQLQELRVVCKGNFHLEWHWH